MKVVVTGGSGQLGTLVLERLVAQRRIKKIVSLDLVPPAVPSPRIDWRIADMRDPGLERHLEGADALIHLAFFVARRASAETMYAVNVEGSKRIFESAAQHGVRRVVYSSSVAAYGIVAGHPRPVVETTPRKRTQTLSYADNKYEVEAYLDEFERAHPEVAVVRLRLGILFGRRIAHVREGLVRQRVLPIVGSGRNPVVWDEDVADAVLLALNADVRGAYNLTANDPLPSEDLARLAGFRPLRIPGGATSAAVRASRVLEPLLGERRLDAGWIENATVDLIVSSEKAKAELGWKPHYPTSADVAIAFGKNARGRPDPRITLFLSLIPRLARRARARAEVSEEAERTNIAIHFDITGRRGADFALTIKEGALSLKRGIPRPPDSTVTMSVETFLELLSGKLDPSAATMTGKVRIRGEPLAGLVLGGIVRAFRRATEQEGVSGRIARRLSGWFQKGTG